MLRVPEVFWSSRYMNSSETLEVTLHMERELFENKIVSAQGWARLAQPAEGFNMEDLPRGSMKVNIRNVIPKQKTIK